MKLNKSHYTALMGILLSLCIVLSFTENVLIPVSFAPGVKLGLANIVTMYTMYILGFKSSFTMVLLRGLFTIITRGYVAALMAVFGGIAAVSVMCLLILLSKKRLSVYIISVFGAVSHNTGQLIAGYLISKSTSIFYYLPILMISGIIAGSVTGISLKIVLPALNIFSTGCNRLILNFQNLRLNEERTVDGHRPPLGFHRCGEDSGENPIKLKIFMGFYFNRLYKEGRIFKLFMKTKMNGIHLPHYKNAAEVPTVFIRTPKKVIISMAQHIGAPCEPLVKIGDKVLVGQKIGDTEAFMSAPIHSSVSGEVTDIIEIMHITGKMCKSLVIESDGEQELHPDIKPPVIHGREDFVKAIRESGAVGLGGAGFPTFVKANFDFQKNPIDTLIINGAECEPYITSDYREFLENHVNVIEGIVTVMRNLSITKAIIGIESNKTKAVRLFQKLTSEMDNITVKALKPSYPQGAEKTLIFNTTGRIIKEGELPSNSGCLVLNVSTVGFLNSYINTGIPLISRRITVDGDIVKKPSNLIVPIGTPLKDIVDIVELTGEPNKIVMGGPMMGNCAEIQDTPISKTNNAVLMFENASPPKITPCIRCGNCIRACSMGLEPTQLEHAYDSRDIPRLNTLKLNLCMNCGACTYVCPAKHNISEKNQLAKKYVRDNPPKK